MIRNKEECLSKLEFDFKLVSEKAIEASNSLLSCDKDKFRLTEDNSKLKHNNK
jgi:hypothetical protein